MRPPALARFALAGTLLLGAGCDRAPVEPDGPARLPALDADYRATFDAPRARFFSPGLPDAPCRRASLALRFTDGTIELRCLVVDGIVEVDYVDAGPMDAELRGTRVVASSARAFRFEGTLAADSSRMTGALRNPAGDGIDLVLFAR